MAISTSFLVLLFIVPAVYALDHTVGSSSGWNTGVDYDTWAAGETFTVGDKLGIWAMFGPSPTADRSGAKSLAFVLTCSATVYTVGDNAGWDISSDLDTWSKGKSFEVGDVLLFQYSSTHSVNEVTKDSFNGCNMTNPLLSSSDGNTSIPLTAAGDRYFVCGNKLHCLGGMKLQVNVNEDTATSPANAPRASEGNPSSLPRPSSKNNNPSDTIPASTGFVYGGRDSLVVAFLSIAATLLWVA
ncbi:hypothetical protein HHK36_000423 [Tetracentron sinense]|uniref:Phytocyanin domain-containing protein n=1 Tax=Tetracentron sinense TaxID=13715 RepID=A0A835DTT3_TETSI|nr:hypothetical protein HHK36_000423 [Tetracentron sinense]